MLNGRVTSHAGAAERGHYGANGSRLAGGVTHVNGLALAGGEIGVGLVLRPAAAAGHRTVHGEMLRAMKT